MKKLLIFLAALFLLTAAVNAEDNTKGKEICKYLTEDLGIKSDVKVPAGIPYNNERFNLYTKENQTVGHITLEKKQVSSIGCGLEDKPTYDIYIKDIETLKDIFMAEKPLDVMNKKISSKDLEIKGQSTGKKIKGFFTRIGLKVAGWFN